MRITSAASHEKSYTFLLIHAVCRADREYGTVPRLPSTLLPLLSSKNSLHWRPELWHSRLAHNNNLLPRPHWKFISTELCLTLFCSAILIQFISRVYSLCLPTGSGVLVVFEESSTGFREVIRYFLNRYKLTHVTQSLFTWPNMCFRSSVFIRAQVLLRQQICITCTRKHSQSY